MSYYNMLYIVIIHYHFQSKHPNVESAEKKSSEGMLDFKRILMDSPSTTMTATKWRVKLLQELSGFMGAVLTEQSSIEYKLPLTTWQVC